MKEYSTREEQHRVRKPIYENNGRSSKKNRAAKARQQRLILAICICAVLLGGIVTTAIVSNNKAKKKEAEAASSSVAAQQIKKVDEPTTLVIDGVTVIEHKAVMYAKTNDLNIRMAPNSYGKIIDAVDGTIPLTVTGKCDNGWAQVEYNGQTAYCSMKYLTDEKPEETSTELLTLVELTTAAGAAGNVDNSSIKGTSPYYLKVNRTQNVVIVYQKDSNGQYNIPVKAMVCSVGLNGKTETGTFKVGDQQGKPAKSRWRQLTGGVYGQYITRFNGSILFHSVPYFSEDPSDLEYEEYNKLGQPASAGCVRLCVRDAKWIYDNCPAGTPVTVYDSSAAEPLAKPSAKKIDVNSPNRGWDPTDPDSRNPWN